MNTVQCPFCGADNDGTNLKCENCGTELNSVDQLKNLYGDAFSDPNVKVIRGVKGARIIVNIILLFFLGPWVFLSLVFIGFSSYSLMLEHNQTKYYSETEGKLVDFTDIQYNDSGKQICAAVYEYTVRGTIYQGSPKQLAARSAFKETVTVKYNSDNPSEYLISVAWPRVLLAIGIIMCIVLVAIIVFINVLIVKHKSKLDDRKG